MKEEFYPGTTPACSESGSDISEVNLVAMC